jgi:hypothetical protein
VRCCCCCLQLLQQQSSWQHVVVVMGWLSSQARGGPRWQHPRQLHSAPTPTFRRRPLHAVT